MAKDTNQSTKETQKVGFFGKIGRFFVRLFKNICRAFKEMFAELKKVSWPTKKETINYSIVVFAFMVVMGVIIGLIDLGAGALVNWIIG